MNKSSLSLPAVLLSAIFLALAAPRLSPQAPGSTDTERVQATARLLAASHNQQTGLFDGTGWWNSANGISALVNAGRGLHTKEFEPIFENTFSQAPKKSPGFLNEFYDDEGWWALAWLDVYQLHGGKQYLKMSQSIFADMTTGWSDTCGGGIWWKKNERYKNAIANELFLSVAVRLALASTGKDRDRYLDWAKKEASWFESSGMINDQNLVNDGLDSSCHNNQKTTWTYNQGVLLTGLSGLAKLTHSPAPLALANKVATATSQHLADADGILHDPCEPGCGEDGIQFKGILVRNLVALQQASPSPAIASLLEKNATSLWTKARTGTGHFSVNWAGPPQEDNTGSLISALDGLTAPLLLKSAH